MENEFQSGENILDEPSKKNNKLALVIIAILLVILIGIGLFYFLKVKKPSTENVYYSVIDTLSSSLIEGFDDVDNKITKSGSTMDMSFDLKSNDKDIKALANIINNLGLKMTFESDNQNKKLYANINADYKNSKLLNAELMVNGNAAYANIKDLYDRPIKLLEDETLNEFWSTVDTDSYKVIVTEMQKIIKESLKEEYFTKTVEEIEVLGKNISVINHTMNLDEKAFKEIETNIIDKMLANDKLLDAMVDVSETSKSDIVSSLNETKNSTEDYEGTLKAQIYLNKNTNEIEKIIMNMTDDEEKFEVVFNKTSKDSFEILVDNKKVGTLTVTDKNFEINIDYEGSVLELKYVKDKELNIRMNSEGILIELNTTSNKNSGTLKVRFNSVNDDIDLTVNVTYELKEISNVNSFSTSNYVEFKNMSENDLNAIMGKLYENNNLLTLIQDLSSSGLSL